MPEKRVRAAGLLGSGIIGGGWAARLVLNGVDVRLYDPAPDAVERVQETLANARRAYGRLTQVPLPAEGALTVVESVADAVRGVELVQESAPERLELKQQLLAAAARAASPDTLICSSTSGLRPSLLAVGVDHPERLLVAHPFNPVHLLPLVELCAGQSTAPETVVRASEIFRAVGMHPLVVRKEVEGFIANRLQEAMLREALWLVHDDVASVQEIDDAICYSFGLRRAVVGPFSIGGGGAAMRHLMEKWEPELRSPWTKYTDIPEHNEAFLDKQSDARDDNLTIAELEQKRDDCLVAVLQGLRAQGYGAGETLARWEQGLRDRAPQLIKGSGSLRMTRQIPSDWIDYNGHLAESRYLQLCGIAADNLLNFVGIDSEYRSKFGSYYTLETHLSHFGELYAGDRVLVLTQVLGADGKRLHLFHVLKREGDEKPAATGEQMLIHVKPDSGRSGPVQGTVRERMLELASLHADLPRPERAGASIRLRCDGDSPAAKPVDMNRKLAGRASGERLEGDAKT
ncbi:3-hydroxyacyl-CoA dehydrogenase NAD-binding domain-containing protein [Bradyrhizobium sp. UFLA06-06]